MTETLQAPDSSGFRETIQAQSKAADPERSAWVEANAGSGKTKVLIDRVARLLLRRPDGRPGAHPDTILCVTYTKAAANEMLSRLFERLGSWSISDDDALRRQLAGLEGRSEAEYDRDALDQARSLFARALETPGGLRIETIHAFCARILRRFPLEAGVAPGFEEMDDEQAELLWRQTVDETIESAALSDPDAIRLVSEAAGGLGLEAALDAIRPHRGALIRLARHVDNSDRRLTDIIHNALGCIPETRTEIFNRHMIEGLPRDDISQAILDLTTGGDEKSRNTAASKALAQHLTELLCADNSEDAFAIYMTALAGKNGDWPSGTNPYAGDAFKYGHIADLFRRNTTKGDPEGREITRMKEADLAVRTANTAERSLAMLRLGLPIIRQYQSLKENRALLDFDDLIEHTRRLLSDSSAAQWVLYKLDGGLSHILLDEAQDTSPEQWLLMNALVAEFHAGVGRDKRGDPRTQFVVGDPKQSIYSFQGADQERFKAEQKAFSQQQVSLYGEANLPEMTMSFRSSPEILEFVDAIRRTVPLDSANLDPEPPTEHSMRAHVARRSNQPGRVELWPLFRPPIEDRDDSWQAPTDHIPESAPARQLASGIADAVRAILDEGDAIWREDSKGGWRQMPATAGDILILVRRRSTLFHAIISELKRRQVAVAGADRLKLTENIGVQDCLNLVRFALQPRDDLCLAEILRGPFCNLVNDDQDLFPLAYNRAPDETLWDRLRTTDQSHFAAARTFCHGLIHTRGSSAFDFLTHHLNARDKSGMSGWDKLARRLGEPVRDPIRALISKALGHDLAEAASLQNFLAEVEADQSDLKRELGESGNAVRVMTVHGAKGLQAPIVILPDTCAGTRATRDTIFVTQEGVPLYAPRSKTDCPVTKELRDIKNSTQEKESRRLLYVALTRAQDRLIICGAALTQPKIGYATSAWYKWGIMAMRRLTGESIPESGPDDIMVYGAPNRSVAQTDPPPTHYTPLPQWLRAPVSKPERGIRLAAPSHIGRKDRTPAAGILGGARRRALRRGQIIHDLLERLPTLASEAWQATAEDFLAQDPDLSVDMRTEILNTTLATLADDKVNDIFFGPGRREVAIVGTISTGAAINGRVDRLIIHNDRIRIVDYKTDRPAPEDARAVDLSYKIQMGAYSEILAQLYPDHAIECALLYTDGPKLLVLDPDDMSESLKGLNTTV